MPINLKDKANRSVCKKRLIWMTSYRANLISCLLNMSLWTWTFILACLFDLLAKPLILCIYVTLIDRVGKERKNRTQVCLWKFHFHFQIIIKMSPLNLKLSIVIHTFMSYRVQIIKQTFSKSAKQFPGVPFGTQNTVKFD